MSSLVRFLFTLGAVIAAASLLAASLRRRAPPSDLPAQLVPSSHMAGRNRSFVLWLHGLGDSGPANEPIRTFFSTPEFRLTKWAFPSAPNAPVSCNHGAVMPSWFDIHELPLTAGSPQDESGVLKAVENVHAMINKEVADGVHPENIFVCGFSQGGALTLASVLLYPKTLGGGAVFSGWVPFGSSVIERISPEARKTPILWSHGMADRTVLFEAGQACPPFCNVQVLVVNLRHTQILATRFPRRSCIVLSRGSRVVSRPLKRRTVNIISLGSHYLASRATWRLPSCLCCTPI